VNLVNFNHIIIIISLFITRMNAKVMKITHCAHNTKTKINGTDIHAGKQKITFTKESIDKMEEKVSNCPSLCRDASRG
jgi:hypothetical protein